MCKIDSFKTAFEARNLEITLFWTRSNYFLLLNTVIFSGLLFRITDTMVSMGLSLLGLLSSVLWFLVNSGSRFWILRWEGKLEEIEGKIEEGNTELKLKLFHVTMEEQREEVRKIIAKAKPRWGNIWQKAINWFVRKKPPVANIAISLSLLSCLCFGSLFVLLWKKNPQVLTEIFEIIFKQSCR